MKIYSTKHLHAWRIISPSREPTNSHRVGLQNKFRTQVRRLTSGLFYENSTELDEVGKTRILPPRKTDALQRNNFSITLLYQGGEIKFLTTLWLYCQHNYSTT